MRVFGRGSLVLITGGAGFVGATAVARLIADGCRVRVLDDFSSGRRERLAGVGPDLEIVTGDVRCERTVRDACRGVSAVVHLAAVSRARNPLEERRAHDVAVTGTWNLLAAAREEKVHRVVVASSAAVYGPRAPFLLHEDVATRPNTTEGAHKLAAETYARLFHQRDGLATVVLRLFSVYGPGQDGSSDDAPVIARFVHQIAQRGPFTIYGDGGQTRDFVHVEDVARAIGAALKTPGAAGRTFNVASSDGQTVKTIAAIFAELVGGLPPPRHLPMRPGEPRDVRASIAAAAAGLGWKPQTRLRDGLRSCLAGIRRTDSQATPVPKKIALPPPPLRARGTPPPIPVQRPPARPPSDPPLFAGRPPSWAVPDDTLAPAASATSTSGDAGTSIPVVIQEDPLWT
jgi:UDP-glucose 4-epimerase